MKRIYTLAAAMTAAITLAGCAGELENDIVKQEEVRDDDGGTMLLGAVLPGSPDIDVQTKTEISDNGDKTYSVFWTEEDEIVVNGNKSRKTTVEQDNRKNATFTLDKTDAPYLAVYPSGIYMEDTYSSDSEALDITVPATQKYIENGSAYGNGVQSQTRKLARYAGLSLHNIGGYAADKTCG